MCGVGACLCVCVYMRGDEMEISAETNAVGYQKRGKVSRGHIKDVWYKV